jgi:heterodisulfide reductase subunit C
MTVVSSSFIESVDGRFDAAACMNCGVCTALCPMEIKPLPRVLFRLVMLGLEEKVLTNKDTIYSCLLCRMCEVNCPAGVPIAENVRLLRNYVNITLYGIGR